MAIRLQKMAICESKRKNKTIQVRKGRFRGEGGVVADASPSGIRIPQQPKGLLKRNSLKIILKKPFLKILIIIKILIFFEGERALKTQFSRQIFSKNARKPVFNQLFSKF